MNQNIVNVYVLKLFSLRKNESFSLSVEHLTGFFDEMTLPLTKVTPNYKNILAMGDFNVDIKCKSVGLSNHSDCCGLFHLTNIVKFCTCYTKTHASLIDLILTNSHFSIKHLLVKPVLVIAEKLLQYFSG